MANSFMDISVYPDYEAKVFELNRGFEVVDITRHFYPPTIIVTKPSDTDTVRVAFKVVPIRKAVEDDGYRSIGVEYFQKDLCVILMKVLD